MISDEGGGDKRTAQKEPASNRKQAAGHACQKALDGKVPVTEVQSLGHRPVIRFMSHVYLNLPDTADRPVMFRVIDESFWANQTGNAVVTADELCGPRSEGSCKDGPEKDARLGTIADMMEAGAAILAGMRRGMTIGQTTAAYTAKELRTFAKAEGWGRTMPLIFLDSPEAHVTKALNALEATPTKKTGPRAAF